jgi:hypothetical protein
MVASDENTTAALYRLAYVSQARTTFARIELLAMLNTFRGANRKLDITGILLHKNDEFMQLLEGPESVVLSLFERIENDPRHTNVVVVAHEEIDERQFSNWSMAFRDLNTLDAITTPGYSEFLNVPFHTISFIRQPNRCQELMLVFRTSLT